MSTQAMQRCVETIQNDIFSNKKEESNDLGAIKVAEKQSKLLIHSKQIKENIQSVFLLVD